MNSDLCNDVEDRIDGDKVVVRLSDARVYVVTLQQVLAVGVMTPPPSPEE